MKIVIGTESFWPNISGVAIFAADLADFMTKHGQEVFVVTPSQGKRAYLGNRPKYKILAVRAIINPFRRNTKFTFGAYGEIKNHLDKIKPDLIHLQDPAGIGSALIRYGRENRIPLVMTNHFRIDFISAYLKFIGPLRKIFEKFLIGRFAKLYNSCDVITTPSETNRKLLIEWGVKREIKVFFNGVETGRFRPGDKQEARKKLGLGEKPTVIYAGRIDKDKSLSVLFLAIPKVLEVVEANFLFVGGGRDLQRMRKVAEELKISKNVRFYGFLANNSKEYPLTFQASDIFTSPSTIETQSIVMLEALSAGLPIVAARAGSFPEFIKEGKNGFLFEPGNSADLATKLITIISQKETLKTISHGARQSSLSFDKSKTLKRFLDLYEELVKKNQN